MPKRTFDQVSAALWGRNALDYDANYRGPRAHWSDADVREEALYFAGLARGLRLGVRQDRNPSPPTTQQGGAHDRPRASIIGDNDQTGTNHLDDLVVGKHAICRPRYKSYMEHQTVPVYPLGAFRSRCISPFPNVPETVQGRSYMPVPQAVTHGRPSGFPGSGYIGRDPFIPDALEQGSEANEKLRVPEYDSPDTMSLAGAQQPAKFAATRGKGCSIAEHSEVVSTPGDRTASIRPTVDWASRSRAEMPTRDPSLPQPLAPARKEHRTFTPLVEYHPEDDAEKEYENNLTWLAEQEVSSGVGVDEAEKEYGNNLAWLAQQEVSDDVGWDGESVESRFEEGGAGEW